MVLRYRARWESPLDLYHDTEVIDRAQHQAGLWFGQAYRQTVSSEAACHDRARLYGTPSELFDTSDASLMRALEYVEQTYAALSSDTVNVVIDVCAHARPAATPEAIGKLRRGLGRLAREWGLSASEVCQRRDA